MTRLKSRGVVDWRMDLLKLDPMARKMRTHIDAFYKALEDNDAMNARSHINEITKYADYLSNDVEKAVMKQDAGTVGVNDIYAGGAPVMRYNNIEKVHPASNDVLVGTIRTNRIGSIMRPQSNRTL
jgi:hypothetical protein